MALRRAGLAVLFTLLSVVVSAQGPNPPAQATGSLTSTTSVTLNVSGYASLAVQLTGSWVATVTFEGSIDGATYQTITVTPTNSSTSVTTATANGVWTGSVGGLKFARARVSTYSSGTVVITLQSALAGGSSGGGGGAASSVTINDPTITTQKAAVNGSGQLSITCANCSGSGASAVDNSAFTAGTTSGAPAMGFFHSTIDAVTDGATATLGMDAKRNLFTVLRDAAGNARGVNVTAGNALTIDGSGFTQPISSANLTTLAGTVRTDGGALPTTGIPMVAYANSSPSLVGDLVSVIPRADDNGVLWVHLQPDSVNLTRDEATQADDGVFTPAVSRVMMAGATFDDVAPDSVNEGDGGAVRMSANRNLYNTIRDAAGNERGANVNASNQLSVSVDNTVTVGSHAVTNAGTFAVQGDLTKVGGTNISTGTGTGGVGIPRVTVSNDSNILATQSGTWTVQPGNTANTTPWAQNVTQFGGTNVSTGTGVGGAGIPRVTVSSDSFPASQTIAGTVTANQGGAPWTVTGTKTNNNAAPGATNLGTLSAVATAAAPSYTEANQVALSTDLTGALRVSGSAGGGVAQTQVRNVSNTWTDVGYTNGNLSMPVIDTTNQQLLQALLVLAQQSGYIKGTFGRAVRSTGDALDVNVRYPVPTLDPCQGLKANVAISQTANAVLLNKVPGRLHVCSFAVVGADAENIALVEGTGTTCGTSTAGVIGGTTAATGPNFAANGGLTFGNGGGAIAVGATPGNDLCLLQSGSGRVAGNLTYALSR